MKPLPCLLLLVLCLAPVRLLSQSTSATISGGITDTAGNFIIGANVLIVNDETGVLTSVRSNGSGMYFVPILPPGHYHLQISKQGFKTIIKPDVVLNVQTAVAINFVLPIGSTSQSITVEASSSLLNTTDATVSTVIDRKFVENIPLNGRSFQDLISMTPGVVTQSPQTQFQAPGQNGDFSVNGQRTESNSYSVDGVSGNITAGYPSGAPQSANSGSIGAATALGTTQSLVSVDALQEFRVLSSTYSAEYGRTPGGQFALVTRSGTDVLHGSAFDYLRNSYFDANDWFNDHYGLPQPALRQNDFGGTVGGPLFLPKIYRDKTFFFISYEGLRLSQPVAATIQYVPDNCMRQSAPASIQAILNAFPLQNGLDYGTCIGTNIVPSMAQFISSYSLPSNIDSTSVRVDHVINPHLAVFFRFGDTPSSTSSRSLSSLTKYTADIQTYTLGLTGQLSKSLSNEFRLGYASSDSSATSALDSFGGAVPINLAAALGIGGYSNPRPSFQLSFSGIGLSNLTTTSAANDGRQWNAVDTANLSLGKHQLKFGVDYRDIKSPLIPPSPYAFGLYVTPADVLSNSATILSILKTNAATPIFHQFSAFAQDEWRLKTNVALSLGLRWEVNPPPTEEHGDDPYTLLGDISQPSSLTLAPQGTPLWKTTWFNLAPRLGVAWTANQTRGRETVLRTGGGVFFDTDNELATQGFAGLGFSANQRFFGAAAPITPAQLDFSPSATAPYASSVVYAFPAHLQLPYTYEWNASLQQALGQSQSLTVSYVGSNGRRLITEQQLFVGAQNPEFGTIVYVPNGLTSSYQALQLQFQRSVEKGLQALASYTWSHSLDFGSNSAALPVTRGNSDFDLRNNFSTGLSWDLPNNNDGKILRVLLDQWGVDGRVVARSGFPVTLQGNYTVDPSTGSQFYGNLNLVPNQPIYLNGSQYPGRRAINPAAFAYPSGTEPGNAPRNFVRGFATNQVNLAVRRDFPVYDRLTLDFRAEAFNLLNHPNFGYIDSFLGDATFGQATQMLNQSLSTMSSLYQQGGPRSMQFALKLKF
ncbi:TonB-dependent receptor [Tunturiibacter lichenicola]|uniref:TonB-dependent receptor n=1 Tax=Tunturiibacter lichenicola TaxID=2051959 RepID=UPI0021B3475E|nr:carboxypeptidase regulatory-like domain-containing protein [Edaphobacter lichenicola]